MKYAYLSLMSVVRMAGVFGLLWVTTNTAAADDYKLAVGDVLDFAIAGAPDMARKIPVDIDGTISLPLVGEVKAAGQTVNSIRAAVRRMIGSKEYRSHANQASPKSTTDIVWPDQVSIGIAEYRPVYLNGDVAKPGAQPFRPGMTVRQALSLAGGYDILRFRMENPFLVASDVRSAYESAWIEYAREQVRLKRIRSELGLPETAARKDDAAMDPAVSAKLLSQIERSESDFRQARQKDFSQQHAHLKSLINQDDRSIDVLTKLRDAETDGSRYDEGEFKRIESIYQAGTMPMTRVAEARRVMLLSATQALQSSVELERAKTDREQRLREIETLEDARHLELVQAEQDSQTKLADIRVRIQANGEKLLYTGALKTQLARGTGGHPDLVLFRDNAAGVAIEEDAEMHAGDVVEVALHVEGALDAPTR